jgi:hypothetical protein
MDMNFERIIEETLCEAPAFFDSAVGTNRRCNASTL